MKPEDYITREEKYGAHNYHPCRSFSEEAKACSCGTWKENVILISCPAILP